MASTSSSSIQKNFKYDIFLSFRGEDTRKNFVDHLYYALKQKGLVTYKDDENIEKGKRINDQLIKSIEDSRCYIIVFSKNYASSSWCLDELVKIMECQKMTEHTAYPIFYDVQPTEIRKQIGAVKVAFAENEKKEAAGKWRKSMEEAAALAGSVLEDMLDGHEAKFIQKFVQDISRDLHSVDFILDEELVGMGTRIRDVVSSLEINVDDVRMLGIWGMGGAGKTTLAKAVFDQISFQFEGKSFVENVREESKPSLSGLKSLQKQVLSDISNDQGVTVSGVLDGKNKMKKAMGGRKVLVVLDDVNHKDQLEALAGNCNWFKPGSRIIITTRDKQVLAAHGVGLIHNVTLLSQAEADCLFSRCAFGRENPIQGYEELSGKILQYADGLPLTIKVMGSHLRDLDESEWKNAIKRLETIPLKDTMEVLEISYNGLEEDCRQIFLDVACILKGWDKEDAIRVLESLGFCGIYGLRVLLQKSLITYDEAGRLGMHDQLEEMGWNIVRRSHPDEPQRHSRLWVNEENEYILTSDLGTQATKCLCFYSQNFSTGIAAVKGLAKMKDLRFIYIIYAKDDIFNRNIVQFCKVGEYLPNSLRFMTWWGFPFSSLPNTFQGKYLVELQMKESNIVQLWEDGEEKVLHKLRFLTFCWCPKLQTLDLRLAPNLEQLTIYECFDLVELQMPVESPKLEEVNISDHSKLKTLHLGNTPNLKTLILRGCNDLVELQMPVESPKLEYLDFSDTQLKPLDLGLTPNLEWLKLENCYDLVEINTPIGFGRFKSFEFDKWRDHGALSELHLIAEPTDVCPLHSDNDSPKFRFECYYKEDPASSFGNLERLISIGLCACINLESFSRSICSLQGLRKLTLEDSIPEVPRDLDQLEFLEELTFSSTEIKNLPDSICLLKHLKSLKLESCLLLEKLPDDLGRLESLETLILTDCKLLQYIHLGNTPNLEKLILEGCIDLVELQMPAESPKLEEVNISHSKLKTLHLGNTPNLGTLILECNDLVELQMPAESLKLEHLDLSHSKLKNLHLGSTPNLEILILRGCHDLVELQMQSPKLEEVDISHSKLKNLNLGSTPNLKRLTMEKSDDLVELQMPAESPKLEEVNISHSKLKTLYLGSNPNLKRLTLEESDDFVELQMPAESPKLEEDNISHSKLKTLYLGSTPNLKRLTLEESDDLVELQMPAESPKLEYLGIWCSKLKTLHLGNTPNLETLILEWCNHLVELQMPAESLKLAHLDLSQSKLTNLHLGNTPNLEKLILEGCNDFVELQMPVESPKLECLYLTNSKLKTLHLGNTPNLEKLILKGCNDLVELRMPVESPKLVYLDFSDTKLKTLDLGLTPNLEWLKLKNCYDLVEINAPIGCGRFKSFEFDKFSEQEALSELRLIAEPTDVCPLHSDNDSPKFRFECYYKEDPASSFGNLERLISIGLCACINLESFSRSICSLQGLRKLTLEGSIPEVPLDLDLLECLEELIFSSTKIRSLPDSICMLMHPKAIRLKSCWHLEKLPEDLGRLLCLEELDLTDCIVLRDIPNSICQMKSLKYFYLPYCFLVEKLPEEIGSLKQLKELNIEGTGISHLPQSIFQLEGLRIVGFTWQLQSYGFTSMIQTSKYVSFSYIEK